MKTFDIELKAENSRGKYWGVGPNVTVLQQGGYDEARRYLCLTDIRNDCKHVQAVKQYLGFTTQEAAA